MDRAPGSVFCHLLHVKRVVAQDKNTGRPMGGREWPSWLFRGLKGGNRLEGWEQGSQKKRWMDTCE